MENSAQTVLKDRRADALGALKVLPDEILCFILEFLCPRDIGRLSCVSSVMYILCNEEPLWMSQCLKEAKGPLQYKGSWKKTTLFLENVPLDEGEPCRKPLQFDGFGSLFLYRRLYRCHTTLNGFSFDSGNVERRQNLTLEDFRDEYDAQKPVLLAGLAEDWPARHTWTIGQLVKNYGDTEFRISQRSPQKVSFKLKDYVSYMDLQHDEDPLYIFDDKFGEAAPGLMKEYSVPHLFQEDFFDILDGDQRPSYRWLIIGPERSGASWHVDPALTSAWNTLLCGRKRWALYPPGRVPLGVTVHVNDEDGDVNIDTPSSLQWWLDFYPLLADEDKPIECTQLPGETIYVPSGWWHCVLNLENTVAVTQNFVNTKNFEFVCLDMAPGYRHKGVCRAGLLALDEDSSEDAIESKSCDKDTFSFSDLTRKEKRVKVCTSEDNSSHRHPRHDAFKYRNFSQGDFIYDINFLSRFLDKDRDHYNFPWSPGNCMGPREMRDWLSKLWVAKPELRDLVWRGACIALNAGKWSECLKAICAHHNLAGPTDDQRLPVGTGSNPVYIMDDCVIKIFVEEGLEASLYGLGTELDFYNLLGKVNSPLKKYIPGVMESGILYIENGSYAIVPWNGREMPNVIAESNVIPKNCKDDGSSFDVWSKKAFECSKAGKPIYESSRCTNIWPYIVMERCKGKIYAKLRDILTWEDTMNLASFLGEQLRNLHLLPIPPLETPRLPNMEMDIDFPTSNGCMEGFHGQPNIPAEWNLFIRSLILKKKDVCSRLSNWGYPIPRTLIEKVDEYIPDDLAKLIILKDGNGLQKVYKSCTWIHSDIMDDNVHMEPRPYKSSSGEDVVGSGLANNSSANGYDINGESKSWRPSHILDFSDLSIGDPVLDLIPIYLDIFRGDPDLLKQLLKSYKLPLVRHASLPLSPESDSKFGRLSYHAMCYCILHEENVLGAIFSIWKELRGATSWEEVENTVWGDLNNYKGFS